MKILLSGANGRMGQCLAGYLSHRPDCTIVAGVDTAPSSGLGFPVYDDLSNISQRADVLIDFSVPEATQNALLYCAEKGLPCVICTTGLPESVLHTMRFAACETAVFCSANLSLCVSLMQELCRQAMQTLGMDVAVDIVEAHHSEKKDSPSGTALSLAQALSESGKRQICIETPIPRRRDQIVIHPLRAGNLIGEHTVLFTGQNEQFLLRHTVYSREIFAAGALAAAEFLIGKPPGLYKIKDLIKK